MPRDYRYIVLAVVGCLIVVALIGLRLQPKEPYFPVDRGYEEQSASYRVGGADCDPKRLNNLSGRERERQRDACEEAKEQHREAINQLIAARRAAVAADTQAILANKQTGIAGWGVALGFVTTIAAIGAALFAERAAFYTKDANRIAKANSELEYRPILVYSHYTIEMREPHGVLITPIWKNIGRLPAKPIRIQTWRSYLKSTDGPAEIERMNAEDTPHDGEEMSIIGAGEQRLGAPKLIQFIEMTVRDRFEGMMPPELDGEPLPKFTSDRAALLRFHIEYKSVFGPDDRPTWHTDQIINYLPSFDAEMLPTKKMYRQVGIIGCPAQEMT